MKEEAKRSGGGNECVIHSKEFVPFIHRMENGAIVSHGMGMNSVPFLCHLPHYSLYPLLL